MKKRILSLALTLCMCIGLLPTAALAEDSDFEIENGVLIDYYGSGGNVVIPEGVTTISDTAFVRHGNLLKSVTFPNSVTSINKGAFYASALEQIVIPDSVAFIGSMAFQECANLKSVTIGSGMTSIESQTFYDCTKLESLIIGPGVLAVKERAFEGCTSLASITIPDNVLMIGEGAFGKSSTLKELTIGKGVSYIGAGAFSGSKYLTSVTIPNSVKYIDGNAFIDCPNLTDVTISADTVVYNHGNENPLREATHSDFGSERIITYRAEYVEYDGEEQLSITGYLVDKNGILNTMGTAVSPSNLEYMADSRLYDMLGVTEGDCPNLPISQLKPTPLTHFTIPDGVTKISSGVFAGLTELESVTIPDSVTEIGMVAFENCTGLTSIAMGNGTMSIGSDAFMGCTGLKSVVIGDGVVSVGSGAFMGCTELKSIVMGDRVVNIDAHAFSGCVSLESVTLGKGLVNLNSGAFGRFTRKYVDIGTSRVFESCTNLKRVIFPPQDDTTSVLKYIDITEVFSDCPALEEIINCPNPTIYQWMSNNQSITSAWSGVDPSTCITPQSERITALSNQICAGLTDNYKKAKAIFVWLTANIDYDYDYYEGRKSTTTYYPEEVLDSKLTICDGYSRLNQALLQAQGIPALRVTGLANGGITNQGGGHAWNMAFVDGRWIYSDATWGRPRTSNRGEKIVYGYNPNWFDPTLLNLSLSHHGEQSFTNPSKVYYVGQNDTPSKFTAAPNRSAVLVNGQTAAFDAYTINQNNYFKLRDLAKVLSGTGKQFEITWDGSKNAINLVSDKIYTVVGGEMAAGDGTNKDAALNTSAIYLNGQPIQLTAYTINGNNYFKLRDIGKLFNFGVAWDGANNAIIVDTAKAYTED